MGSSSNRKSGSLGGSPKRRRVVIGADETVRVRYKKERPEIETERKHARESSPLSSERAGARIPKPSAASNRVATQKRDDRDQRRRQGARRRLALALGVVAAAVVLAWGIDALWRAPVFVVASVEVTGTHHLSSAEVIRIAQVPRDATLLRLPEARIAANVRTSPWVESVRLARVFPHTLAIEVTERTPVVLADTGANGVWLVTRDGYWVAQASNAPTSSIPLVKDVPNLQPVAGSRSNSQELNNAVAVAAGLSPQMRAQVRFVSAPTIEKTMLVLKDSVQVFVGSAEEIAKKDLIARTILQREKNVVYVNVRVTDRPTWRGLNQGN